METVYAISDAVAWVEAVAWVKSKYRAAYITSASISYRTSHRSAAGLLAPLVVALVTSRAPHRGAAGLLAPLVVALVTSRASPQWVCTAAGLALVGVAHPAAIAKLSLCALLGVPDTPANSAVVP